MSEKAGQTRYTLQMRVSADEVKTINDKASQYGLTVSEYMRLVSLHGILPNRIDTSATDYRYGYNRDVMVQTRVSRNQYNAVQKKAARLGLKISQYLRYVCLNAEITVHIKPPS